MDITITIKKKESDYLIKKYGSADGIIKQVVLNWLKFDVNVDYDVKISNKKKTDKKIDELDKLPNAFITK